MSAFTINYYHYFRHIGHFSLSYFPVTIPQSFLESVLLLCSCSSKTWQINWYDQQRKGLVRIWLSASVGLSRQQTRGKMSTTKPKILVTRSNIPDSALDIMRKTCDVETWETSTAMPRDRLLSMAKGKDGMFITVSEKVDAELCDAAGSQLKVVATMSVGHDHIDLGEVKKRGIKIGYTPGVLTMATAELTVAVLLATSRKLFESHGELVSGGWTSWDPFWMVGHGLEDATVGIVGLGRIGQAVLKMLRPFGVAKFLYHGHNVKTEGTELGAEFVSFDRLLCESDFVIVTCPLTDETRGMFNDSAFKKMKRSAIIVNTSRGGVIDQDALVRALKNGDIGAAGLDVMTPEPLPVDHELTKLSNCVLIPHIGSGTIQSRTKMSVLTAENIICALENKPMPCQLC